MNESATLRKKNPTTLLHNSRALSFDDNNINDEVNVQFVAVQRRRAATSDVDGVVDNDNDNEGELLKFVVVSDTHLSHERLLIPGFVCYLYVCMLCMFMCKFIITVIIIILKNFRRIFLKRILFPPDVKMAMFSFIVVIFHMLHEVHRCN